MPKKILITCYEVPGHGGASTSSYNLFRMLQQDGLDVHYMNIIRPEHELYYKYIFGDDYGNPRQLENVYNCILDNRVLFGKPHKNVIKMLKELQPDVVVGVHYYAVLLIKEALPEIPVIYYASGCMQIQELLTEEKISSLISFCEQIKQNGISRYNSPEILNYHEKIAVEKSDLILTHSEIIKLLYEYFYAYNGKIYDDVIWKFEWIYNDAKAHINLAKPFEQRVIDVLFISTDWKRVEKNKPLLLDLLADLQEFDITVIGEVEKEFSHVNYENIVSDRSKFFEIMGNAKSVVSVSNYDPAPGILYEASAIGCNIVASKNCGNWQICSDELLVNNYNRSEFLGKIKLSLKRKFDDNKDYFVQEKSYKNLIDIITVFS